MILLISYDLNGHERPDAYRKIHGLIESNAIEYKKPMYSQWFVRTNKTPQDWTTILSPAIDKNDNLFILEVHRPYQGTLSPTIWPWLRDRI